MLEVSLLGVGTVLRLERGAWSMVKCLRKAINECALGADNVCLVGENPAYSVPAL